ncbi:hypothetical protein [Geminocystis sp. NIES-3709]|uniref:hypothetical protein n=1 Tax=Geminocystis sp. NIES-3709 TaxID=1617448 RepID=UPI0005FC94A4|nr:hypothetical protein [Geminocystis sp. NIES-3709]BAQ66736.1 carboxysome protein CcmN [Geminocystis sp. NIES-3709]
MSLPILHPSTIDTTQIRGNVTIDQSVIIASGVILNATQGNKIIIHGGVCLGMGTIITAYNGDVEIRENTILGSGSLILGKSVIGSQVSLGASVTVYNSNIESMSVIPAGSIIGDRSRQINFNEDVNINSSSQKINSPTQTIIDGVKNGFTPKIETENIPIEENNNNHSSDTENYNTFNEIEENITENEQESPTLEIEENSETEILNNDVWEDNTPQVNTVVGQVYINKLLFTLFPERKTP